MTGRLYRFKRPVREGETTSHRSIADRYSCLVAGRRQGQSAQPILPSELLKDEV